MRIRPVLLLLLLGALAGPSLAQDAAPDRAPDKRTCICAEGKGACQHFLRTPLKPTVDPCWCHKCREFSQHDGATLPTGWNEVCFRSKKTELYLKRHAAAWGITCSDCVQDEKTCKFDPDHCPNCGPGSPKRQVKDYAGRPAKKTVMRRLGKEERLFKKPEKVRLLYNEHFYLVTDVSSVKVMTGKASSRVAKGHEWAHMMMERAEYARRDFIDHFGSVPIVDKPTGMYIPEHAKDAAVLQGNYLGNRTANILYGGSDKSSVADGFCFHGFVTSMEEFGDGGDDMIHLAMRHMIGHELMSCWVVVDGHNRALPRWVHVGAAHWLSRLQPRFAEDAFACNLEGTRLNLPGDKWDKELAKIAKTSKPGAIEKLFGKTAQGQLSLDDHRRAWSYFALCLAEWREPFVQMLTDLRKRREVRDAFMDHLKVTPEIFDERWKQRVTGKLDTMAPVKAAEAAAENEAPTTRERDSLRKEKDPETLAARIRGLGTVDDPKTAELLVDLLATDSALVRETILVALLKIEDPAVITAAWNHGLGHDDAIARAYTAQFCAKRGLGEALPRLREQLEHKNWYARAEAAIACGTLGDKESLGALVKLVNDPADKARVAAMDALALLGEFATPAVGSITPHLKSSKWQLRVVACQSLGGIGSMEAVEDLISRMEEESGRVREELHDALAKITRDDLGKKPEYWRKWWEQLKARSPGKVPDRPAATDGSDGNGANGGPAQPDKPNPDDRYATEYFGIELFSSRVAFVLDTSESMELRFAPKRRPGGSRRRLRGTTKIEICKREVMDSLDTLDPRSHFNVISFGSDVKAWKKNPILASRKNVDSAIAHIKNLPSTGETNYYDALRAVLDVGDRPDASPSFRTTPDTITFLTDGMPTKGEITHPAALLGWYSNLNRYARVTTHVIAFGDKGLEIEFLRGLAERNYGVFVHVPGNSARTGDPCFAQVRMRPHEDRGMNHGGTEASSDPPAAPPTHRARVGSSEGWVLAKPNPTPIGRGSR